MNNQNPRVKPIVRWPGGKSRLLKKILPMIPPHELYGEVFGGGLATFFAKERSPLEIVNDVNGDLVALYLNVQRHLPEVLRQVESFISSRQLFYEFGKQRGLTEIERAGRFLLRNRISFGGGGDSFGVTKTANGGGAQFTREKVKALLEAAHERLNGVIIENLPYDRFLKLYDKPEAFFFFDPPYINAPTGAYDGWTEKDAVEFRKNLRRLKANWLVTINDCELTRDLFADCKVESVVSKNGCVNNALKPKATFGELIITPK
jgi:DNA adenine methylase